MLTNPVAKPTHSPASPAQGRGHQAAPIQSVRVLCSKHHLIQLHVSQPTGFPSISGFGPGAIQLLLNCTT